MRLLFVVSEDWYFVGHRLALAKAARTAGYAVGVATRVLAHREPILEAGLELFSLDLVRSGRNPLREIAAVRQIAQVYRRFQPDIVHHVAMKPILYGSLAARLSGVSGVVNAIAGLGYAFSSRDLRARLIRRVLWTAYGVALRRSQVILQNRNDLSLLAARGIISPDQCTLIPGSGVDLAAYAPAPEPTGIPLVVLPARMLRDKGVEEFVAAATILHARGIKARFALVGIPDSENPASISESKLHSWEEQGIVELWGWRNDMAQVYASANIVCLPSYREGLPKSLIEAAACGRPIVTCDVPGCRDTIIQGESGLLVPPRNAAFLADALRLLIMDPHRRVAMGARARKLAEERFSIESIAAQTLAIYERFRKR